MMNTVSHHMNENPIIFSNLSEILSKVNLSKLFSSSKQSDKTTLEEKAEIDFLPNLSGRVAGNGWNGWKWLEMAGHAWNRLDYARLGRIG